MPQEAINLAEKLSRFDEHWSPRIIAQMNDYHFKLAKIQGAFIWHSHPDTDEVFMVIEGSMEIALDDRSIPLRAGEMYVVPKGVQHRPIAEQECHILLIEPVGTVNTGDAGGPRTTSGDTWI